MAYNKVFKFLNACGSHWGQSEDPSYYNLNPINIYVADHHVHKHQIWRNVRDEVINNVCYLHYTSFVDQVFLPSPVFRSCKWITITNGPGTIHKYYTYGRLGQTIFAATLIFCWRSCWSCYILLEVFSLGRLGLSSLNFWYNQCFINWFIENNLIFLGFSVSSLYVFAMSSMSYMGIHMG